jgi:RNA recognition motif-containing protein
MDAVDEGVSRTFKPWDIESAEFAPASLSKRINYGVYRVLTTVGDSTSAKKKHPSVTISPVQHQATAHTAAHVGAQISSPNITYDMLSSAHPGYTPLLPSGLLLGSPFTPGTPTAFHAGHFPSLNAYPPSPTMPGASNGYTTNGLLSPQMQTYSQFYGTQQQQNQNSALDQNGLQIGSMSDFGHSPLPSPNPFLTNLPGAQTCRTVYLGNIPSEALAEEILSNVRTGPIESIRILPEKNCAFISFLDVPSAQIFHTDATLRKLTIGGQEVKIGWGKPSSISASVMLAVQQNGASRNVFLGNLPDDMTREEIEEDLGKFGAIEHIKLIKEKNIAFVHFLSIANAMKAVQQLPSEANWAQRRVYYGKDRCGPHHKGSLNANHIVTGPLYSGLGFANLGLQLANPMYEMVGMTAVDRDGSPSIVQNLGNRTVYLGNIHPETTLEEICNVVRGGILHHIRYIADKHICFVTFVDSNAAVAFYQISTLQGLMIHNRRLKIGWGKHSGPLPPGIAIAVHAGASRNVYIGNVDFETFSEEKLRQDFSEYGDIELVNTLREKSCAFVNFTNISSAIKAIDGASQKEEFKKLKINFGKDRCGNPPRATATGTTTGMKHEACRLIFSYCTGSDSQWYLWAVFSAPHLDFLYCLQWIWYVYRPKRPVYAISHTTIPVIQLYKPAMRQLITERPERVRVSW